MLDWTIIGAGVSGALIAHTLAKYDLNILILEAENDVACGATKANTALIHAGYDAPVDSIRGKLNVRGNALYGQLSQKLNFEFERIGSLVLGEGEADYKAIHALYENGLKLGVPNLQIIDQATLRRLEPNVNEAFEFALYAPSAGITEPWEVAIAACENAMDNGVLLRLNYTVKTIAHVDDYFLINSEIKTRGIINCAGVHADDIYQMIKGDLPIGFEIIPRRGEYYLLDKEAKGIVNQILFTCPTKKGKGTIIAPTAHGNVIVGPNSEVATKDATTTTYEGLQEVKSKALYMVPGCPLYLNIANFSGVRAEPSTGDFIIEESEMPFFINVAGIKSPGLSAAPAIAEYVEDIVKAIHSRDNRKLITKAKHIKSRRARVRLMHQTVDQQAMLISENRTFGHIVCRCERISEGEIVDAIHRNCGATTLNGVKRRVRPGGGRCQGGFCGPKVLDILARERNKSRTEIEQEKIGSWLVK
jgi:glycerol-3-phosphate dehydrogenase